MEDSNLFPVTCRGRHRRRRRLQERALKRARGKLNLRREVGRLRNDDMLISSDKKKKSIENLDSWQQRCEFFNA
uniref:Uncharacterized protein n=1 Tax=Zea mays TaxID=4577 RepID=B6UG53_MAIZE|nr:hypothetical protein [Zea mays]